MTTPTASPVLLRPLLGALDHASDATLPARMQAGRELADHIQQQAEQDGRPVSRETALLLAGQQLESAPALPPATLPVVPWTNEAMEALYPQDVAPWKRTTAPLAFVVLAGVFVVGGLQGWGS